MFADDQIHIYENVDGHQRAILQFNLLCKNYNMVISEQKTKTLSFRGAHQLNIDTQLIGTSITLQLFRLWHQT